MLDPLTKSTSDITELVSCQNGLSRLTGGNREMDQLYTTSQVSNITKKNEIFSH